MKNIDILKSNLFDCESQSLSIFPSTVPEDMPEYDVDIARFTCGSDGFNSSMYSFTAVFAMLTVMFVTFYYVINFVPSNGSNNNFIVQFCFKIKEVCNMLISS